LNSYKFDINILFLKVRDVANLEVNVKIGILLTFSFETLLWCMCVWIHKWIQNVCEKIEAILRKLGWRNIR